MRIAAIICPAFKTRLELCCPNMDDWKSFAMELWGLSVTTWTPLPERAGSLPAPLEYDTLLDGLVELEAGQRHMVLQCLSCYQVIFFDFLTIKPADSSVLPDLFSDAFRCVFPGRKSISCDSNQYNTNLEIEEQNFQINI
jgi:hypothetical protein